MPSMLLNFQLLPWFANHGMKFVVTIHFGQNFEGSRQISFHDLQTMEATESSTTLKAFRR
jgi:hypothetical protein